GKIRRESCGITFVLGTVARAVSGIRHLNIANAEPGHSYNIAGAAIGMHRQWTHRAEVAHSRSVQQRDFLVESHLFQDKNSALIRGEARVHPRPRSITAFA